MKRLLFLCSRGVVSGPMAKALFQHMGPSLLLNWEVFCLATSTGLTIDSRDSPKVVALMQKYAVPFTESSPRRVTRKAVAGCTIVLASDPGDLQRAQELLGDNASSVKLQLLGDFHPEGPGLLIPDPAEEKDCKAYEKTYWQVYKSMRGLVAYLKAQAEAEKAARRPLKLPDPTIFTVTSPSAWQKNHLRENDDLCQVQVISPSPPSSAQPRYLPSKDWFEGKVSALSPPQLGLPLQIEDSPRPPRKFSKPPELLLDPRPRGIRDLLLHVPNKDEVTAQERLSLQLTPPELVEEEEKDAVNFPSLERQQCVEDKASMLVGAPHHHPPPCDTGAPPGVRFLLKILNLAPPPLAFQPPRMPSPPPIVSSGRDLFDDVRIKRVPMFRR